MDKIKLGEKIRSRRAELGITQEDLAELSDTSSKTLREIEKGKGNPRLDTIITVLKTLGLSLLIGSSTNKDESR